MKCDPLTSTVQCADPEVIKKFVHDNDFRFVYKDTFVDSEFENDYFDDYVVLDNIFGINMS